MLRTLALWVISAIALCLWVTTASAACSDPVTIAEEPHKSVVIGAGRILEDMSQYEKVIFQMKRE